MLRQHVVGDGDVCAAADDAAGAAGAARVRDVVWPRADSGDDALPCASSAEIDFSRRASPRELPELMDGDCSYEDFRGCLRSLEQVNRWLLGYRPTLAWLERLPMETHEPLHIVDVGSGGGDLLRQIARWARRRRIAVQLTGIDLNPYATRAAAESTPKESGIAWVTGDALEYRPEKPMDIVVSSLMAHHLEDDGDHYAAAVDGSDCADRMVYQ